MTLLINNQEYDVIVEKKNNKNLYIRITDDLNIKVTCPLMYSENKIKKILDENKKSISSMIDKQKNRNRNNIINENCLLGKQINIVFKDVKQASFSNNVLVIKNKSMLDKWYKEKACEIFKIYLDEVYLVFEEKIPYSKLKIRSMKTRWGVCNRRDNSVTLNLELIKKDHKYLNYVIVHELSHFIHFNHSKSFWKTVEKYCPEYKEVRKELKE